MSKEKDYCSCFPEVVMGIRISSACKLHDQMCGEKGTYLFFDTILPFYHALRKLGVNPVVSGFITLGGTLGYLVKYPYLCYKKYQYRNSLD